MWKLLLPANVVCRLHGEMVCFASERIRKGGLAAAEVHLPDVQVIVLHTGRFVCRENATVNNITLFLETYIMHEINRKYTIVRHCHLVDVAAEELVSKPFISSPNLARVVFGYCYNSVAGIVESTGKHFGCMAGQLLGALPCSCVPQSSRTIR